MFSRFARGCVAGVSTMALVVSGSVVPPAGFRPLGQTLVGNPAVGSTGHFDFGRELELSKDGDRMAVGANGVISVYERTETEAQYEDFATGNVWRQIWEIRETKEIRLSEKFSFVGNGQAIAVRHDDDVQVYDLGTATPMGDVVSVCESQHKWNRNVKLFHTGSQISGAYWLLVSCEADDNFNGKVELLKFDLKNNGVKQWVPFAAIFGEENKALFGWSTGINVNSSDGILIAVTSPWYDNKRGMVQTFNVSTTTGEVSQYGENLLGQEENDQFGFSLDLNPVGMPHLVVGAPQCAGGGVKRGCVTAYTFTGTSADPTHLWYDIGESPMTGEANNDRFGRAVAIATNGERFVASSVRHNQLRGKVRLFVRSTQFSFVEAGSFVEDEKSNQFGSTVSMNWSGSMIASGSIKSKNKDGVRTGEVQIFVEASSMPSEAPSGAPSSAPTSPEVVQVVEVPALAAAGGALFMVCVAIAGYCKCRKAKKVQDTEAPAEDEDDSPL